MPELKKTSAPVQETLLLICEKCGKRMMREPDAENPAKALQHNLKSEAKAQKLKGILRPVLTSCLDICPEREVAIGHIQLNQKKHEVEFFTVACEDPDQTAKILIDRFYPKPYIRRNIMSRGDKSKYTDKQKRQAAHIEKSYEKEGLSKEEAERRAWATVNKTCGGGKKGGRLKK